MFSATSFLIGILIFENTYKKKENSLIKEIDYNKKQIDSLEKLYQKLDLKKIEKINEFKTKKLETRYYNLNDFDSVIRTLSDIRQR
jgi:thiamine biosynthesis lipoprotein ApbE